MDAERSVKKMVAWSDLLTEALEMVASDDPTRFGTRGPQIIKADIAEAVSEFTTAVVKMAEPGCLNSNSDGTCPDGGKGCCFCPRVYAKAVALEDERKEAAYDGYGTVAGIVKSVVEVSGFETHEGAPGEGTRIYNSKFNGMLTCTVCGQVFKDGKCGCQTVAAAINAGRDNYKLSLEAAAAAIDLPEGTKFVTEAGVITVYAEPERCDICGGKLADDDTCSACIERYEELGIDPDCVPLACPVHGSRLDKEGNCSKCAAGVAKWSGAF